MLVERGADIEVPAQPGERSAQDQDQQAPADEATPRTVAPQLLQSRIGFLGTPVHDTSLRRSCPLHQSKKITIPKSV